MSHEDHQELVAVLLNFPGYVILSGYQHTVYEALERAGWERRETLVVAHSSAVHSSAKRKPNRTECLWLNPRTAAWNNSFLFNNPNP